MKKNEFKKMMKKENKAFKNYYVYEMILILLLAIIVIPNIILTINNMIPFNITIINTLLIIIVALPIIVLDIKNDLDIKNIHQYYLKEEKIPKYKDKTKILNVYMSDEIVNVKYPNRNAPSLIFNSFVSIFNINRTPLHNKKTNYF